MISSQQWVHHIRMWYSNSYALSHFAKEMYRYFLQMKTLLIIKVIILPHFPNNVRWLYNKN